MLLLVFKLTDKANKNMMPPWCKIFLKYFRTELASLNIFCKSNYLHKEKVLLPCSAGGLVRKRWSSKWPSHPATPNHLKAWGKANPSRCNPMNCLSYVLSVGAELNNSTMILGQLRWKLVAVCFCSDTKQLWAKLGKLGKHILRWWG